jgi:tetratricopeptide (TPR) repeat protein
MLSEEALILFAALAALGLLILGVLELVAPTRRRRVGRDPWRRARPASVPPRSARAAAPLPPRRIEDGEPPIERLLRAEAEGVRPRTAAAPAGTWPPKYEPRPRPVEVTPVAREPEAAVAPAPMMAPEPVEAPEPPVVPELTVGPERDIVVGAPPDVESEPTLEAESVPMVAAAPEPEPVPWEPAPPPYAPVAISAPEPPAEPESPVERCYALYEAKQFHDVLTEAMGALENREASGVRDAPEGVARLWGVIGLAQRAMGEPDAAYVAFGEAIAAAGVPERQTWERYQATLALEVGRDLIARADAAGRGDGEERVAGLRTAMSWLERGLTVAPDDRALRDCARAAREALWPTYEQAVLELMQRQEYEVARRLIREAVASPDCPTDFQTTFRELLSGTYSGEVGQLTAEALRRMRDGDEGAALSTLDRAEAMLAAIPEESVPERRRQELERRLWWSYTKVGIRWVEGGMNEQALAPLLHALRFANVGPQRLDETRRALARAFDGLVGARAPLVERLLEARNREEARALVDPLWASIEQALAQGMSADELGEAFNRVCDLRERLLA